MLVVMPSPERLSMIIPNDLKFDPLNGFLVNLITYNYHHHHHHFHPFWFLLTHGIIHRNYHKLSIFIGWWPLPGIRWSVGPLVNHGQPLSADPDDFCFEVGDSLCSFWAPGGVDWKEPNWWEKWRRLIRLVQKICGMAMINRRRQKTEG